MIIVYLTCASTVSLLLLSVIVTFGVDQCGNNPRPVHPLGFGLFQGLGHLYPLVFVNTDSYHVTVKL
jgi:hypothetical protein